MDGFTAEGLRCSWVHLDIFSAYGLQDAESILRGVFERSIAMDGAHAQEVQSGTCRGQQNRKCVLEYISLTLPELNSSPTSCPDNSCQFTKQSAPKMAESAHTSITIQPNRDLLFDFATVPYCTSPFASIVIAVIHVHVRARYA